MNEKKILIYKQFSRGMQSSMHSPNMYGNESMHANLQVCLSFTKRDFDHFIPMLN